MVAISDDELVERYRGRAARPHEQALLPGPARPGAAAEPLRRLRLVAPPAQADLPALLVEERGRHGGGGRGTIHLADLPAPGPAGRGRRLRGQAAPGGHRRARRAGGPAVHEHGRRQRRTTTSSSARGSSSTGSSGTAAVPGVPPGAVRAMISDPQPGQGPGRVRGRGHHRLPAQPRRGHPGVARARGVRRRDQGRRASTRPTSTVSSARTPRTSSRRSASRRSRLVRPRHPVRLRDRERGGRGAQRCATSCSRTTRSTAAR